MVVWSVPSFVPFGDVTAIETSNGFFVSPAGSMFSHAGNAVVILASMRYTVPQLPSDDEVSVRVMSMPP